MHRVIDWCVSCGNLVMAASNVPRVAVLRGGIQTWKRLYRDEEGLLVPCFDGPSSGAPKGGAK